MIDINKKYRTRRGGTVHGLWIDNSEIVGYEKYKGALHPLVWNADGYHNDHKMLDLIEVDEKEELLEEAKRRYPVGTKFKDMKSGNIRTVAMGYSNTPFSVYLNLPDFGKGVITTSTPEFEWKGNGASSNPHIYENGKWAEIVKKHKVTVYFYKGINGIYVTEAHYSNSSNYIAKKEIEFTEGEGL